MIKIIPRTKIEREEWLENRKAKFDQLIFYKRIYENMFLKEAERTYVAGHDLASIVCTSVAFNHLLYDIIKPEPNERGLMPPTRTMLVQALQDKMIDNEKLVEQVEYFIDKVRNQFEHKQSFAGTMIGMYRLLEQEDSEIFDKAEDQGEALEIIKPYIAWKILDYYYSMCDHYFDYLAKKAERKEN